ncbi:hypothetical protein [Rhodopila sp.]|uniref:hypothetical protein n=1 Tax=Rhodopila sp. TaxID=2480087 RepID=UPI003D118285
MRRFAPSQSDLFTEPPAPVAPPERPPLAELADLLARLRLAQRLPWPDAAAAMAEELRALGLARLTGEEGGRLAAAIMVETERLFTAAEQDAGNVPAPP